MKIVFIFLLLMLAAGSGYWLMNNSYLFSHQNGMHSSNITTSTKHMMHTDHAALVTDDKSFIQGMIPHHEEAVVSSEEILKVAKSTDVKKLATTIIEAQTKEISDMKQWYGDWFGEDYKATGTYKPMMPSLKNVSGEKAEKMYLEGMIGHHEAAVEMAEAVLKKTEREEIKKLSKAIIETQNKEINEMKQMLNNL